MLRPWRQQDPESHVDIAEEGEGLYRLGDTAYRRTTGFKSPPCPHFADLPLATFAHLTQAQRHKCLNLYVQLAGTEGVDGHVTVGEYVTLAHVLNAFVTVHVAFSAGNGPVPESDALEECLARAARAWWIKLLFFNWRSPEDRAAGRIARQDWLATCTAVLAILPAGELPPWLLDVHVAHFKLATRRFGDTPHLTCDQWTEWRTAVQRFTPKQMSDATHMAPWVEPGPSLVDVFRAADSSRTGMLSLQNFEHLIERWWTSSDPHCETIVYGL